MPIPAPPDGGRAHPLAAATALFRQLHDQLRDTLDGERRPAMTWLIANYGHAREHLGQVLLTKQLALQSGAD